MLVFPFLVDLRVAQVYRYHQDVIRLQIPGTCVIQLRDRLWVAAVVVAKIIGMDVAVVEVVAGTTLDPSPHLGKCLNGISHGVFSLGTTVHHAPTH